MGLSLIARFEAKRWCPPPERRALYRAIEDAIETGKGPFGSRKDLPHIEERARVWPEFLRRLLTIAIRIERSSGTHTGGFVAPAIDAAARADLAALIQFDPARGLAIQNALGSGGENVPALIRAAVARIRAVYGGKGWRAGRRPNFVPVVGLAARAFDIAEIGAPEHLSISMPPGAKRPPLTVRDGKETGPRVRFTTALLRVAFPGIKLNGVDIRNALDRLFRDRRR